MKSFLRKTISILAASTVGLAAQGQGTFQNLNFESGSVPNVPSDQPVFINAIAGLPGWTAYVGTNQVAQVLYNGISSGGALVGVVDRHTAYYSNNVIEGNFTATLDSGYNPNDGIVESAAIAQPGVVPGTARSLVFSAGGHVSPLLVTFNGQNLPFILLSTGPNYQTYGADISAFAGTSGELRFTEQPIAPPVWPIAYLDNIQFSSQFIPEPSVFGLFALAGVLFGWWFARGKR
jgi:hypothetical protein